MDIALGFFLTQMKLDKVCQKYYDDNIKKIFDEGILGIVLCLNREPVACNFTKATLMEIDFWLNKAKPSVHDYSNKPNIDNDVTQFIINQLNLFGSQTVFVCTQKHEETHLPQSENYYGCLGCSDGQPSRVPSTLNVRFECEASQAEVDCYKRAINYEQDRNKREKQKQWLIDYVNAIKEIYSNNRGFKCSIQI